MSAPRMPVGQSGACAQSFELCITKYRLILSKHVSGMRVEAAQSQTQGASEPRVFRLETEALVALAGGGGRWLTDPEHSPNLPGAAAALPRSFA